MLLYQDSFIKLEYDPSSDVVEMDWPDIEPLLLTDVKHAFRMMVETIRNYDVKNLLVDGSKAKITILAEEHATLDLQLAQDFSTTRIQKIARIQSDDLERESRARRNAQKIHSSLSPQFQMENFTDRTTALAWLKQDSHTSI